MWGVFVNAGAVVVGSLIGLCLRKGLPENISSSVMTAVALCVLYIGWSGALAGENAVILVLSMAIGALIGSALDLDARFERIVHKIESRFAGTNTSGSVGEAFITASLLFCVGAMSVVGSLQAGLRGEYDTLYSKSVLDFISSIILSSTLGIGVALASVSILVFQGAIALLAHVLSPLLADAVISEMTCAGSVLIFALGLNMLGLTKLKVINFMPAMFLPILLCRFF